MKTEIRNGSIYGGLIWLFGMIYASIVMVVIGVDIEDESNPFGIHHEKYWIFELIMVPSFLVFTYFILQRHFHKTAYQQEEVTMFGITIAVLQFVLDLLVLVLLLGNGFEYFLALVTIMYLLIPVYTRIIWNKSIN